MSIYLSLGDAGQTALQSEAKQDQVGGLERKSTRGWAQEIGYDAMKLFNKVWNYVAFFFCENITMKSLHLFWLFSLGKLLNFFTLSQYFKTGQEPILEFASFNSVLKNGTQYAVTHILCFGGQWISLQFFRDDIRYLLSMANLWKKRRPPCPLDWDDLPDTGQYHAFNTVSWLLVNTADDASLACTQQTVQFPLLLFATASSDAANVGGIRDQQVWSIRECSAHFKEAIAVLKAELAKQGDSPEAMLVWDKDDEAAMDFVTSAANVRAHVFGIALKSRFDIKCEFGENSL